MQKAPKAVSPAGETWYDNVPSSEDNTRASPGQLSACHSSGSEDDLASEEPLEISVTQVLQAILEMMYRRNGEPKELADLEVETWLLTGEVFDEAQVLTDREARHAYAKVLSSAKLKERSDSATALELLEECLAEWGIFPPRSILLG